MHASRSGIASGKSTGMRWALGKGATAGFGLTMVVLLTSGWLSYRNLQRLSRNERLVVHTHEVLDEIHGALTTLADAEAGQRSYLISGDADYLQRYRSAFVETRSHVARAIVRHGGAINLGDAFDRFLGRGRPASPRRATPCSQLNPR